MIPSFNIAGPCIPGEHYMLPPERRLGRAAARRIWDLGQGHPWLTNALADQIVRRDVRDRGTAITPEHVDAAKETIILERRSHIDSLVAKLREPRVRRIIEPMLVGDRLPADLLDDDLAYVVGLGLVTVRERFAQIANPSTGRSFRAPSAMCSRSPSPTTRHGTCAPTAAWISTS